MEYKVENQSNPYNYLSSLSCQQVKTPGLHTQAISCLRLTIAITHWQVRGVDYGFSGQTWTLLPVRASQPQVESCRSPAVSRKWSFDPYPTPQRQLSQSKFVQLKLLWLLRIILLWMQRFDQLMWFYMNYVSTSTHSWKTDNTVKPACTTLPV